MLATKKEGGGLVCGTQASDRAESLAPAKTEVRAGAVLPGCGGPEHQAARAVPKPTDNTGPTSHHLVEPKEKELSSRLLPAEAMLCLTDFFNTHRIYRQLTALPLSAKRRT